MGLVGIDLPGPAQLRGRWAAFAAVCAARGLGMHCQAEGPVWHYDDGGGNWLELHQVGGGRAVIVGNDHEYSDTRYGAWAADDGQAETDLLAGAPDWWEPPLLRAEAVEGQVGFAYGYEGGGWRRAEYEVEDGFAFVDLPALGWGRTHARIVDCCDGAPGLDGVPDGAAVDALIAADGDVTEAMVAAVVGTGGWDPAAGAAAARAFVVLD